MSLQQTTSQTVGPYFAIGLAWLNCNHLAAPDVSGEKIAIQGSMVDADQKPVPDAVVEIWQANAHGKYAHPEDTQDKPIEEGFKGYGRALTDENGRFGFTTVKPGRVPGPDGKEQAPHIDVSVFVRGLLRRLVTRIYFANDPANGEDAVLALVPAERRDTLMAKRESNEGNLLRFDIHLSGDQETVFFDV